MQIQIKKRFRLIFRLMQFANSVCLLRLYLKPVESLEQLETKLPDDMKKTFIQSI